MESNSQAARAHANPEWVHSLRLLLAIGVVWALLHFLVTGLVLPRGLDRPPVIAASGGLAAPALVIALLLGTTIGVFIAGRANVRGALLVSIPALVIWASFGGTMDKWLTMCNVEAGPPVGAPYWPLMADYLVLFIAVAGVIAIGAVSERRGSISRVLRLKDARRDLAGGLATLALVVIVATVVMGVLMGPAVSQTHRGQVYFAVLVAFFAGAFTARSVLGQQHQIWYWLAPFVVGLAGLIVAAAWPALMIPDTYRKLNLLPAWWLARPLPVEMVGVGLLAIIWSVGGHTPRDQHRSARD